MHDPDSASHGGEGIKEKGQPLSGTDFASELEVSQSMISKTMTFDSVARLAFAGGSRASCAPNMSTAGGNRTRCKQRTKQQLKVRYGKERNVIRHGFIHNVSLCSNP